METLENKKTVEYVYSSDELSKLMKDFLKEAKEFIIKNEYHLNEKSQNSFNQLSGILWSSYFKNISKNIKKKINKNIMRFRKKQSLESLNRFFHFIHTRILAKRETVKYSIFSYENWTNPDFIEKVKVEPSLKHMKIQEKRKKWKEAQAIANGLLKDYKDEKGDYYKLKYQNN